MKAVRVTLVGCHGDIDVALAIFHGHDNLCRNPHVWKPGILKQLMDKPPPEHEIQQWLEARVEDGTLLDHVQGEALLASDEDDHWLSAFPFDTMVRRAFMKGGEEVLHHLEGAVLVAATKDASRTKGERLLPDLVLVNVETHVVIIVEVKRSSGSERETDTELLAYEQEITNHLPFASHYDVVSEVLSTEFDTLVSHSLAALVAWHRRQVLCLKLDWNHHPWSLQVALPDAWHAFAVAQPPDDALQTYTIVLNPDDDLDEEGVTRLFNKAETAFDFFVRESERGGGSGFALLWGDAGLPSRPPHLRITVGGLNPWALRGFRPEDVSARWTKLDERLEELVPESDVIPNGLSRSAMRIDGLVEPEARAVMESQMSWAKWCETIKPRSYPIAIDFWGALGDFARTWIAHSTVRKEVAPDIGFSGTSWQEPRVGIPILWQVIGQAPFDRGIFGGGDVFRFGVLVGSLQSLANSLQTQPPETQHSLGAWLRWRLIEFQDASRQIFLRVRDAGLDEPPHGVQYVDKEHAAEFLDCLKEFANWFHNVFLHDSPAHAILFNLGLTHHSWLDAQLRIAGGAEKPVDDLGEQLRQILISTLHLWKDDWEEAGAAEVRKIAVAMLGDGEALGFSPNHGQLLHRVESTDRETFVDCVEKVLAAVDVDLPPVTHNILYSAALSPAIVRQTRELVRVYTQQDGQQHMIAVRADGQVDVAPIPYRMQDLPESEVWVQVDSGGISTMKKFRWLDLEKGADVFTPLRSNPPETGCEEE